MVGPRLPGRPRGRLGAAAPHHRAAGVGSPPSGRPGYGRARLYVDGALAADSDTDGFPAGFGFLGAAVELELEVGRTVEVMLEAVQPDDNTYPAAMVDVGVAERSTRSVGLDEAAAVCRRG